MPTVPPNNTIVDSEGPNHMLSLRLSSPPLYMMAAERTQQSATLAKGMNSGHFVPLSLNLPVGSS